MSINPKNQFKIPSNSLHDSLKWTKEDSQSYRKLFVLIGFTNSNE